MAKIKTGDQVVVLAGRSKGMKGQVMKVLASGHAYVQGVNMHKKHMKPNPQAGKEGGIVQRESKIDISNIAIVNPSTGKADRVGYRKDEKGKNVRFFKSDKNLIDQ